MERITVTLPEDLAALLRLEARRRRVPVSQVLREAATEYLCGPEDEVPELPFIGLFNDTRLTSSEDIDKVLEESWAQAILADRG